MLKDIINERIELSIATQAEIAQSVGTTPAQISLYLRGKASLNNDALENCLTELNINVETYHNRYVLAKEIAYILKKQNISSSEILNITKDELIEITNKKELRFLRIVIVGHIVTVFGYSGIAVGIVRPGRIPVLIGAAGGKTSRAKQDP